MKRMKRHRTQPAIDEVIAQQLRQAAASGELSRAKGYGEPLPVDPGWDETPEALRMPFKILKDAGIPPPKSDRERSVP